MPGYPPRGRGGGGGLGLIFAGFVPLASQNPYPIIVNSVAKYRPHLSHFWEKCNFRNPNLQNNLTLQKKVSGVVRGLFKIQYLIKKSLTFQGPKPNSKTFQDDQ